MMDALQLGIPTITAGAGRIGIMPLPDEESIQDIADWGATLVVSMTTPREMDGPLAPHLAPRGIAWEHLPIVDFGAPQSDTQREWTRIAPAIIARIAAGEGVIVHCRGGCGRSGMIALRLLVEMGEQPEVALSRLRAVRPCAVETREQYDWAAAGVPQTV